MGDLRVGLVGAGGVGTRHAATLAGLAGVRLVAVTDPDAGRASVLAAEHDARAVPDVEALLGDGPDAVWLCLPPFAHGAAERAVVDAGVPFFVEKPLAADLAVAEEVAALVAAAGLVTATGYHWRCMDGVRRAAEVLADAPVRLAQGSWLDKVPPVPWWTRRELSGGQFVEQATHLVDVLRVLVGEPVSVLAWAAHEPGRDPALVDPAAAATLRFDTGAVATLATTCVLTWKQAAGVLLLGEGTAVEVGELETVVRRGGEVEVLPDEGRSKLRVDAEFCAAVRSGDPSLVRAPYAEALRTARVGAALAASARMGKPVPVAAGAGVGGAGG